MFADRHFHRTGRWHPPATISADTTPPTITVGPAVSAITDSEATVTWTTDEAATGQVGYGLAAPGGSVAWTIADSDLRTGDSLLVSIPRSALELAAGDLVVIFAGKPARNVVFSQAGSTSGWTFAYNAYLDTAEKQTAMVAYKVITAPTSEPASWEFDRGPESTVGWAAITVVLRGFHGDVIDAALVSATGTDDFTPDAPDITTATNGALVLTGHFTGARSDLSARSVGAPSGFTLVGGDKAARLYAWAALAYKVEATAGAQSYGSWTHTPDDATSEFQTFTVALKPAETGSAGGRVGDYAQQTGVDGSLATAHSIGLDGLAPDTMYHYAVESIDAAGNVVTSSDDTFTTTAGGAGDPGGFPTTVIGRPVASWGGSLAEPGYLVEVADPNFEGSIRRITPNGSNWRTQYSRIPPWNADGTLMLLLRDGPRLLDGNTYADLGSLSGLVTSRTIWSATDPNVAWTTAGGDNRLWRVNPGAGTRVVHRQFSGFTAVNNGNGEGRQSNDDRYHALGVGGNTVLVYDAVADTYVTVVLPATPDWYGMSGSGTYLLARFAADGSGSGQGTWAFTRTGSPVRNLATTGHGDVVMAADNATDMYVHIGTGAWRATRINDGQRFDVSFGGGGHASGCAYALPGWVLISSHYPGNFSLAGMDQVALCKVDGSLETRVFCHARTVQTASGTGAYTYVLSTHAGVSPDGKKATWAGAWERATTGNTVGRGYVTRVAP